MSTPAQPDSELPRCPSEEFEKGRSTAIHELAYWLGPAITVMGLPIGIHIPFYLRALLVAGPQPVSSYFGILLTGLSVLARFSAPVIGLVVLLKIENTQAGQRHYRRTVLWGYLALLSPVLMIIFSVILSLANAASRLSTVWMVATAAILVVSSLRENDPGPSRKYQQPRRPGGIFGVLRSQRLLRAHRLSAVVLLGFALLHMANHVSAFWSIEINLAVMRSFRPIYQNAVVEPILIFAILIQMITGLCLFHDGRGYRVRWLDKIQAYSGLYLSTYFVIHGAATIFLVRGITFYEASGGKGGLLQDPSVFLSYYSLAVLALFVHTACALRNILTFHWSQRTAEKLAYALIVIGFVTTTTIAMALSGVHLHNDRDRIAVQRR